MPMEALQAAGDWLGMHPNWPKGSMQQHGSSWQRALLLSRHCDTGMSAMGVGLLPTRQSQVGSALHVPLPLAHTPEGMLGTQLVSAVAPGGKQQQGAPCV